jgi:MFS family permease
VVNSLLNLKVICILFLFISFGSVNAIIITPALPDIKNFYSVSIQETQYAITLFLVGYTITQVVFGALSNITGRKIASYLAITLAIIGLLISYSSLHFISYKLFLLGRLITGIGAGAGMVLSFTIISDLYKDQEARKMTTIITTGFAVSPGIATLIGGILSHSHWESCIIIMFIYSLILLVLVALLPETNTHRSKFKIQEFLSGYKYAFKNKKVTTYALIYGAMIAVLYILASLLPFIARNKFDISVLQYGIVYFLSYIGYMLGNVAVSISSNWITKQISLFIGVIISLLSSLAIGYIFYIQMFNEVLLFALIACVLFGIPFIFVNASVLSLGSHNDKGNASSVLNLISMSFACAALFILPLINYPATLMLPLSLTLILVINLIIIYLSHIYWSKYGIPSSKNN